MNVFKNSKWIWISDEDKIDEYADFCDKISYSGGNTVMNISCDSDYTLYINGTFVASNQYGDFEHYKIYDLLDITPFLTIGENEIKILVHHSGYPTSRYRPAKAGLIYEIVCEDKIISYSNERILSRKNPAYVSGNKVLVSSQLGFTFAYDATKETDEGYAGSVAVNKNCIFYPRPIKKSVLKEKKPMTSLKTIDDCHYLIDLGSEVVGVPTLDVISDTEQKITIAYGEHIVDGGVRMKLGGRNFYYEYTAKCGQNVFTDYMLRLGCRYLEIFTEAPIKINYIGVLPQVYETVTRPCEFESELDRRIYDICINTLNLCMMEHYVDCPWREQALYACDSRNQMLCGYYAFEGKNAEYARSNLALIGEDRRDDDLLSICYPCGRGLAIPSFSLYYLIEMKEYLEYTGDVTLARKLIPKLNAICREFIKNSQNGIIQKFYDKEMWNFYDWSPYSSGTLGAAEDAPPDIAINALFIVALDCLEFMCNAADEKFIFTGIADNIRTCIRKEFLTDDNLFTMHKGNKEYTVLAHSLVLLANVATGDEKEFICDKIISGELIDCSLSMKLLEYEALLGVNTEKYRDFVLDEIRTNYKKMLDFGSSTVWETIKGESDFSNAGSLCHGWSAVPVYIFHKLGIAKYSE
ncbi:MAG: hypothetical protein E7633_08605 [Ruminococcaceae bacterium]|nr:hypothetical protein [Oscillospiraceae bacterium]